MATPGKLKSRFAPLPIETIFHSVRKPAQAATIGPNPELTPDPSLLSASPTIPEPQHRVRFHPQLIETSRRTRRAEASGPATKPADKTDITPYTNHIYQVKHKLRRRRGNSSPDDEPGRHMPPTRRETDEEGAKQYLLQLTASHASRQFEEAALAAFPNSRAREGGVAHFYFRDSSSSENSADDACPSGHHGLPRPLRKSTNLGLNLWHKHMQEHAQYISHDRRSDVPAAHVDDTLLTTDSDLDKMDLSVPPNPLWTTGNKATSQSRPGALAALQTPSKSPMAVAHPDPFTVLGFAQADPIEPQTSQASLPSESLGIVATRQPVSVEVPDPGRQHPQHGLGGPFQSFGLKPEDPELHLMRQAASPPMLGKDLIFRRCPSPKQTKLETDHPFVEQGGPREKNRDVSGQGGLWKGYCYRSESDNVCIAADAHRTNIIVTPQPPASPREIMTSGPPSEGSSSEHSSSDWTESPASSWTAAPRSKNGQAKGLHMLHGLDERLNFAKAQAERDEKILHEFNDEFVTQVYNYLSLGYPATARAFDDELAKISRVSVEELCRDDNKLMAKGHMLELNIDLTPEEARCPRWKALKIYIFEWARQHPDLDRLDPLGWGVRERKDSWAI